MVKEKVSAAKQRTVTRFKRLEQLVLAASLLTVSVYSGYNALNQAYQWYTYPVVFAAVLIGLVGAKEFLKHLDAQQ